MSKENKKPPGKNQNISGVPDDEKRSKPENLSGQINSSKDTGEKKKSNKPNEGMSDESAVVNELASPLPLLCLRDVVVFPHMVVPLFVGRPKSVRAIEEAMLHNKKILLVTQKKAQTENPQIDEIYQVGTIAEILQMLKMPDGIVKILAEGLERAKIKNLDQKKEFIEAEFDLLRVEAKNDPETKAFARYVIDLFEKYIKMDKKIPLQVIMIINNIEDTRRLADMLIGHLNLKLAQKQEVLEILEPHDRLKKIAQLINREIEIGTIEKKIRGRVKRRIEKIQKEYYLREQMKAIQSELGDTDERDDEIQDFRKQLEKAKLPAHAKKKVEKEIKRLAKMPSGSAEATVVSNYIEWVLELPWKKSGTIKIDIANAAKILDEDHFGLKKVKERILEFLAVCSLKKQIKGPILCLIGPPGVGKTSLGRSIARAMNRKFVRISLGGMRDEAEIRGHRKTYIGAMPGRIIQAMRDAGQSNPVCLLDEIDKLGSDFRGDPSSALLEVLDPEQNHTFTDYYINMPYDLSNVFFITTANVPHTIPSALRDRMETIRLPGYTEFEKLQISKNFLVPKQIIENGLENCKINFNDSAISKIIRDYTQEAGVRTAERTIASICRKLAMELVKKIGKGNKKEEKATSKKTFQIGPARVSKLLGPKLFKDEKAHFQGNIGVAMGLAWTQTGGSVLPVETRLMGGRGRLLLTGQLGEVMQESCQAALSFLRSNMEKLGIKKKNFEKTNVHIHFPEGGIPKDGPSAGITIVASLYSALKKEKVKKGIAMTGEITLSGRVIPVGGIKEKVIAAHRYGFMELIICKENEVDLLDVPKEIKHDFTFRFVETIDEVLKYCFPLKEGSKKSLKNK
ncbi:endopeptidase La [Candidatus Riflebacteria bacterium]